MAVSTIHAPDPELIREWMRLAIAKSGLSASALAKKAGVAQTTVTRFLRHNVKYVPSWGTLVQIAAAAGVDPPRPLKLSRHVGTVESKFDNTAGATVFTSTSPDERAAPAREEYFEYLLELRKEIGQLYTLLTAGTANHPELGDISEPWAAIIKLDRWLTARFEKYAEPTAENTESAEKARRALEDMFDDDIDFVEMELRRADLERATSENASTARATDHNCTPHAGQAKPVSGAG
jgi:transcriptional regulator with XRE-family HTH domain